MKTKSFYLIISLFLAFTVIYSSCKKNDLTPVYNNAKSSSNQKITSDLLVFKNGLFMKSTTTMEVDSVVWHLEGLLNLEKANNFHNFVNVDFYKDSTYVIPENGILTMEQINEAYIYLNTKINFLISLQTDTSYKINVIDIETRETNLKDGTISLVMSLSGGFGIINGNYFPFGSTDWWYWGFDYGKCGDYQGQSVGFDATDVLEAKFNHPLIVFGPGFFTNVISTTAFPWEYSANNNPGPCSYYMMFYYSSPTPIPPPCLSPEELNFYLSTFDYIKAAKRPSASLVFCNVDVTYDIMVDETPDNGFHKYELYYGNFVPHSEE